MRRIAFHKEAISVRGFCEAISSKSTRFCEYLCRRKRTVRFLWEFFEYMQIAIKRMRGFVRVQLKLPLSGVCFLCDTGSSYALNFEEEMWPPLQKSFWPTIQPKLKAWLLKMSWYPRSEMATYTHASSCLNHARTFDHPDESTLNVSLNYEAP